MENKNNIYEKLSNIQVELKCNKSQYNSFGKYNYRNCEDILEAAKPICAKHRTSLVVHDEIVELGDRYYIKAIATLYDFDSDKEIEGVGFARESLTKKGMDDSQITGSTSSYARKYALNGLFNIDDTKDADTDEFKKVEQEKTPKGNNRDTSVPVLDDAIEIKMAKIHQFYTTRKKSFGPVLKSFLNTRKLSELPEVELDGILELIKTSKNSFVEDKVEEKQNGINN